MASEIRVDKINSLSGVGTVTLSPTGVDISGITTVQTLKVGTGLTASEDGDVFFTGVCTATTFAGAHSGSGANLTSLPAAQLTGALPAISTSPVNVPVVTDTAPLKEVAVHRPVANISPSGLTVIPEPTITSPELLILTLSVLLASLV